MKIVHRVQVFVDGTLIEQKDFTNRVSADQYADKRQHELDKSGVNVRTNVESVQLSM